MYIYYYDTQSYDCLYGAEENSGEENMTKKKHTPLDFCHLENRSLDRGTAMSSPLNQPKKLPAPVFIH